MAALDELRIVIAKITHCDEQDIILETALKDIKADSLQWLQIIIGTDDFFNIRFVIQTHGNGPTLRPGSHNHHSFFHRSSNLLGLRRFSQLTVERVQGVKDSRVRVWLRAINRQQS